MRSRAGKWITRKDWAEEWCRSRCTDLDSPSEEPLPAFPQKQKTMNILLYGVPAEIADRIAGRYSLKLTSTLVAPGEQAGLQLIPPMSSPRQLLAFYNAMLVRESEIDAVIVCDTVSCDAVSTVQYCSPQGKFFTVSGADGDEALEYAISRIVETKLGRVCAHEGI